MHFSKTRERMYGYRINVQSFTCIITEVVEGEVVVSVLVVPR
jgi:hypothetical protein